jgi:hypothetical protein
MLKKEFGYTLRIESDEFLRFVTIRKMSGIPKINQTFTG